MTLTIHKCLQKTIHSPKIRTAASEINSMSQRTKTRSLRNLPPLTLEIKEFTRSAIQTTSIFVKLLITLPKQTKWNLIWENARRKKNLLIKRKKNTETCYNISLCRLTIAQKCIQSKALKFSFITQVYRKKN